jgi:hypothetical protein
MRSAWEVREKPKSTAFKAGHQLAYKGWKFPSALVDMADGSEVTGVKALRALIIAGRYDWFERAAALAPGSVITPMGAGSDIERTWLARLHGPAAQLSRISIDQAEIWMVPEQHGWRVAAIFVHDASASGLKPVLQLATATSGGCLVASALVGAVFVAVIRSVR